MELGGFLLPVWWLWYTAVYIYSHTWALAVSIAALSSVYLAYRHWQRNTVRTSSRPKVAVVVTKHATLVQEVGQVLPVHPHNGWGLCLVSHGLRIFSRFFPSLGVSNTPCLAATAIINVSPKKLLSIATNGRDIPCWLEGVIMVPQYIQQPRGTTHNDADIIQLTFQQDTLYQQRHTLQRMLDFLRRWGTKFTQKYAMFLDGVFTIPTQFSSETFEREWRIDGEGRGQVCWVARQPSQLPYYWSMLMFSASTKEKGISIATLVMLPKSPHSQPLTSALLISQLMSLQDFSCLRRARVYSPTSPSTHHPPTDPLGPFSTHNPPTGPPGPSSHHPPIGHVMSSRPYVAHGSEVSAVPHVPDLQQHNNWSSGRELLQYPVIKPVKQVSQQAKQDSQYLIPNGLLPATFSLPNSHTKEQRHSSASTTHTPSPLTSLTPHTPSQPSPLTIHTPSPPTSPLESQYTKIGKESCDRLVLASAATERDGWLTVGTTKGVIIMKKPPKKGEASVNCIKGTGIINAPPEFVYRIVKDPENNSKLDDLLKESRIIDHITGTTVLAHLLFKGVWPAAPRDFTMISTAGRYNETTLIQAAVSVVDPRLPEEKGYVRGNIVCGGYVIKVCPGKPEQSEVTYVSQAELKGNIPTFVVNKVTESQPQCISRLRAVAEEQYAMLKNDPQKMKEFEEAILLKPIHPPLSPPQPVSLTTDGGEPLSRIGGGGETVSRETVNKVVNEGMSKQDVEGGEGRERGELSSCGIDYQNAGSLRNRATEGTLQNGGNVEDVHVHQRGLEHTESLTALPLNPVTMETRDSRQDGDGVLVMEPLEAYTPDEITSDEERGEEREEGEEKGLQGECGNDTEERTRERLSKELEQEEREGEEGEKEKEEREEEEQIRFEKKLRPYPIAPNSAAADTESLTEESIAFPRQESGGVDFRTLGNQTAARVLEELFHVSSLDTANPALFNNEGSGWKVADIEKDIVILKKKMPGTPFLSFMGKGVIQLPPRSVYDSVRNPQLRFTYDNMLKELHFVKHIEDGLYVLHVHHETTQCFIKQSRDFCLLANERTEGNKLLLVGLSVDIPECPVNPNITRAKITYSGWVVEPHTVRGKTYSMVTYLLQVDLGGVPATLVNYVSKRQPLAIAYLRDYLISTSLQTNLSVSGHV